MGQIIEVFIPDLGDDKDVDLIDVIVAVGDRVEEEDGLITLETDKASMDVPAPVAGMVKAILVSVGMKVNSGDLIAKIDVGASKDSQTVQMPEVQAAPEPAEAAAPAEPDDLTSAENALRSLSSANAQIACQFVNEETICSVIEEVYVPDLGEDKDVDLIEVLVAVGDVVEYEDGLVTLETEKASMDVPAPFGGEILELFAEPGMKVNTGDLIAKMVKTVVMEKKAPTPTPKEAEPATVPSPATPTVQDVIATSAPKDTPVRTEKATLVYASPSVRRLAREFGVDLGFVKGSGHKGRIRKEDIKAYVKAQLSKPAEAACGGGMGFNLPAPKKIDFSKYGETETIELTKIQKVSGPFLHRNWVSIPHITQFDEADITEMEAFRKAQNAVADGYKLSPLVFVLKAVAKALKMHPRFNASLAPDGQTLVLKKYFHIAVAVDTPNGLIVPVIRDVDKKGYIALAQDLKDVSERAREGRLKQHDLEGGCFSISSLGGIGGTRFTPIINAPEVAILGLSKSSMKPVWDGSAFVPRLILPLSLSYDHRVIDGADGARFTTTLSHLLGDLRLLDL